MNFIFIKILKTTYVKMSCIYIKYVYLIIIKTLLTEEIGFTFYLCWGIIICSTDVIKPLDNYGVYPQRCIGLD